MRAIGFTRNSIIGRILVEGLIVASSAARARMLRRLTSASNCAAYRQSIGPLALAMTLSPRIVAYSFLISRTNRSRQRLHPATLATAAT